MFVSPLNHHLSKPCSAVPGIENCISMLVPAFKEKSCPGKVGHPPNRVNFASLYIRKKIDPFSRTNARAHARFVQNSKTLIAIAEPTFVCQVNGFPSFIRRCRKCWLAEGSSGRRVTLLPKTSVFSE